MNCEEAEGLLAQLVYHELDDERDDETRERLRAHVESCAECRELAGDMRVAAKLLKEGVELEAPVLSPARKARLFREARRARWGFGADVRRFGSAAKRILTSRGFGAAAAAVLIFALGAGLLLPALMPARERARRPAGYVPAYRLPAEDAPAGGATSGAYVRDRFEHEFFNGRAAGADGEPPDLKADRAFVEGRRIDTPDDLERPVVVHEEVEVRDHMETDGELFGGAADASSATFDVTVTPRSAAPTSRTFSIGVGERPAPIGDAGTVSRDADPEIAAWWKFDDGARKTAADSSANGNDGTLTNSGATVWVQPQWHHGTVAPKSLPKDYKPSDRVAKAPGGDAPGPGGASAPNMEHIDRWGPEFTDLYLPREKPEASPEEKALAMFAESSESTGAAPAGYDGQLPVPTGGGPAFVDTIRTWNKADPEAPGGAPARGRGSEGTGLGADEFGGVHVGFGSDHDDIVDWKAWEPGRPAVEEIAPATGPATGGATVAITGDNFTDDGMDVFFGRKAKAPAKPGGEATVRVHDARD
ncbi:MAG: IPT/TIG domain-containing protein, partial [Planctomycetota bacterium]